MDGLRQFADRMWSGPILLVCSSECRQLPLLANVIVNFAQATNCRRRLIQHSETGDNDKTLCFYSWPIGFKRDGARSVVRARRSTNGRRFERDASSQSVSLEARGCGTVSCRAFQSWT